LDLASSVGAVVGFEKKSRREKNGPRVGEGRLWLKKTRMVGDGSFG